MKTITLLAVLAMLLTGIIGPKSSVGGPLTDMFILFLAMLAVALYEAWLKRRGMFGWISNVVAAVVGGFVAVSLVGMAMESILSLIHFQGQLASSHHPMLYISEAAMAIFTVLGSWITIQFMNVLRRTKSQDFRPGQAG